MDESTILKIAKYKCTLAELDRQYWFEGLDENYFKINYDRITEEIRRLEE